MLARMFVNWSKDVPVFFEISSPVLAQSRSIVQEMRQRNPPPGGRQAHIGSLPVTGGDKARGLVYGLVVPSGDDRGYPIITITPSGIVSSLGFFDLALWTTMKGGPFRCYVRTQNLASRLQIAQLAGLLCSRAFEGRGTTTIYAAHTEPPP